MPKPPEHMMDMVYDTLRRELARQLGRDPTEKEIKAAKKRIDKIMRTYQGEE